MERVDLLNALRLVRDYCERIDICRNCKIFLECKSSINGAPADWDLDDDV